MQSKLKENRNVRVLAENNGNRDGFNIFLEFSGQREFLMHHRHNGLLYARLKDGVTVADARRWRPARKGRRRAGKNGADELQGAVRHLLSVIDSYLHARQSC